MQDTAKKVKALDELSSDYKLTTRMTKVCEVAVAAYEVSSEESKDWRTQLLFHLKMSSVTVYPNILPYFLFKLISCFQGKQGHNLSNGTIWNI